MFSLITHKLPHFSDTKGSAEKKREPGKVEDLRRVEDGDMGRSVSHHDPLVQGEEGAEDQPDGDVPAGGQEHG